jgi:hypothetical protein
MFRSPKLYIVHFFSSPLNPKPALQFKRGQPLVAAVERNPTSVMLVPVTATAAVYIVYAIISTLVLSIAPLECCKTSRDIILGERLRNIHHKDARQLRVEVEVIGTTGGLGVSEYGSVVIPNGKSDIVIARLIKLEADFAIGWYAWVWDERNGWEVSC